MDLIKSEKIERILGLYTRLINGNIVNKIEEAGRYGVNERTIQRDINDIRCYLENDVENQGFRNTVIYDRLKKGYRLETIYRMKLTNNEILAVCKILLDSRAFSKDEMYLLLDKLMLCCVPSNCKDVVSDLIKNEAFHYVEPRHKSDFLDDLWDIGRAIRENRYININYQRVMDKKIVKRQLRPMAIMFSEFYFYLAAFIDDEDVKKDFSVANDRFPTIYRLDRIKKLKVCDEHFSVPYKDKFEEGEFRKRIQFMYGGELKKIKFKYTGYDIDSILDKLPTAGIIDEEEGAYTLIAETFGTGIDMWLRSQGEFVEIIN